MDRMDSKQLSHYKLRDDIPRCKDMRRRLGDQSRHNSVQNKIDDPKAPGWWKLGLSALLAVALGLFVAICNSFLVFLDALPKHIICLERECGNWSKGFVGLRELHFGSPVIPRKGFLPIHQAVYDDVLDNTPGIVVNPTAIQGS